MAGQVARAVLGEWRPDAPLFDLGSLEQAENVYYADGGYQPFPSIGEERSLTRCGRVYFARSFTFSDGISRAFLFTDCGIFELRTHAVLISEGERIPLSPSWKDGSEPEWPGGEQPAWEPETDDSGVNWRQLSNRWMCRFGDWLIYGAVGMRPRHFNVVEGGAPEELGNAPVNAAYGATVGRYLFLVAGNKVYWSDAQRIKVWAGADDSGNAAEVALPSGGKTLAVHGNRYAYVFCTDGIHIFSPIAGFSPFRHDEISKEIGIISHQSAVMVGDSVYALSRDGVIRIGGLGDVRLVGDGRVDEWLKNTIDYARAEEIIAVHDRVRHVILWQIPSTGAGAQQTDLLLCYAYRDDRFTLIRQEVQVVVHTEQPPVYLDDPRWNDPPQEWLDARSTDDASVFHSGGFLLAGIKPQQDGATGIGLFTGTPLTAKILSKMFPMSYVAVGEIGSFVPENVHDKNLKMIWQAIRGGGGNWQRANTGARPYTGSDSLQPLSQAYISCVKVVVGAKQGEDVFMNGGVRGWACVPAKPQLEDNLPELVPVHDIHKCDFEPREEHRKGIYHQMALELNGDWWDNLQEVAITFTLDGPGKAATDEDLGVG